MMDGDAFVLTPVENFDVESYSGLLLYFYGYWNRLMSAAERMGLLQQPDGYSCIPVTGSILATLGLDESVADICRMADTVAADLDPDGEGPVLLAVEWGGADAVIRIDNHVLRALTDGDGA